MLKGLVLEGTLPSSLRPDSGDRALGTRDLDDLFDAADCAYDDHERAFVLARDVATAIPRPAHGRTLRYLEMLATLAVADVTVARIVEPHVDAAMILAECPDAVDLGAIGADGDSTWGVFAAEVPGEPLRAIPDGGSWILRGTKPWCSLAGELSHALVTARVGSAPDAARGLFAVALRQFGVHAHPESWVARGFPSIPSGPTDFDRVRAVPVGPTEWYLERSGFEWGGIGVAACWFGGAVGIARRVVSAAEKRGDDIGRLHAGRVAASVTAGAAVLSAAARAIDNDAAATGSRRVPDAPVLTSDDRALLAQLTRSVVRRECEAILAEAASALGPAPLALDERYAARVADLELYLRQDHGARDEMRAGRLLSGGAV